MEACIAISVTHSSLWTLWSLRCYYQHRNSRGSGGSETQPQNQQHQQLLPVKLCLWCQGYFAVASLLELLDFPPVWHLSTIPLGFLWLKFWRDDNSNSRLAHHSTPELELDHLPARPKTQ